MDFDRLLENKFVFLDGAMGTVLQSSGLDAGDIPELLNLTNPELIKSVHKSYIEAGSNIVYANTFGANRYKLKNSGHSVEEIISAGIRNAKSVCDGKNTFAALDLGPIGQLLEPSGTLSFDEAYDIYRECIEAGKEADLIVFETMTDLLEIKAGVLAAKENSDKPIICTMTFETNMRTFTGCSVSAMALTLESLGVSAIGVNCSLGPKELMPVVEELSKWTNLPIILKPNAGLPDPETNLYNVAPDEFAEFMAKASEKGVKIFGGCCGTSPDYIRATVKALENKPLCMVKKEIPAAVCSAVNTVVIDRPRIIGERINPTGKKLFKQALLNNDIDYILLQGTQQVSAGADILDVNVGLPDIDEKAMMVRVIKALQGITDVPLQIDSTIPEVLEAALRVYSGVPIVNSVNGEEKSLETVLPLVKKYGAYVVGLTLDENGIPPKADDRFAIAERILKRAMEYGIERKKIFIDCLTLTASAEQAGVMETLNALNRVKTELGLKTVLGVSNISFGLPNRELINHNFLTMALTNGLDLPIINPNVESMTGAVRSYCLLANIDKNATDFISAYGNSTPAPVNNTSSNSDMDIFGAIANGLKSECAAITEKLLQSHDPMDIINNMLIPALDVAGSDFESGNIFLPQLIMSANASQACFEVIKKKLISDNLAPVSKGKIVIATVKGDIHDIGKNIVKVLLENYGYNVIDLGKDVDYMAVVNAVIENDVKLAGLSALMTTTLGAMEETIRLLHIHAPECKIFVGGAVLTPDYALKIGADYYAKDAKESVDIAKKILG